MLCSDEKRQTLFICTYILIQDTKWQCLLIVKTRSMTTATLGSGLTQWTVFWSKNTQGLRPRGRVPQFISFLKFSLTIPPLLNKMVNQADWLFLGPELLSSGWPRLERLTTTLTTCTSTSTKGIRHILETNFVRNVENVKNMASPSYLLHMIISEPGTLGRVCRVKYRALYGAKNCIICARRSSVAVQLTVDTVTWHQSNVSVAQ